MDKYVKFLSENKSLLQDFFERYDNKVVDIYEYKNELFVMFIQDASKCDFNKILKNVSRDVNPYGSRVRTVKVEADGLIYNYKNDELYDSCKEVMDKYVSFMFKNCPDYKAYIFNKYTNRKRDLSVFEQKNKNYQTSLKLISEMELNSYNK